MEKDKWADPRSLDYPPNADKYHDLEAGLLQRVGTTDGDHLVVTGKHLPGPDATIDQWEVRRADGSLYWYSLAELDYCLCAHCTEEE